MTRLDTILSAYVECALWSSTDDAGHPLDDSHGVDDLAPDSLAEMRADVVAFVDDNARDLAELEPERIGHDFWLTRNRHGAGFWDRGLGAVGARLTVASDAYGSSDLYVTDDGRVHVA